MKKLIIILTLIIGVLSPAEMIRVAWAKFNHPKLESTSFIYDKSNGKFEHPAEKKDTVTYQDTKGNVHEDRIKWIAINDNVFNVMVNKHRQEGVQIRERWSGTYSFSPLTASEGHTYYTSSIVAYLRN